jgi:RHS repeat-associated protein
VTQDLESLRFDRYQNDIKPDSPYDVIFKFVMKKTSTTVQSRSIRSMRIAVAFFAIVLSAIVPMAIRAQSCADCQDKNVVRIRFATLICADKNIDVTLNGATASTASTECRQDRFVVSNWTYADMKLDQTYPLVVGSGICSSHVLFDIPEGYTLEINGEESTTITKSGTQRGDGDGTWNLVLKEKCKDCISDCPGDYCELRVGSVNWGVSLGLLPDGRSAEGISLREDVISAQSYTPMALVYSAPGKTNEVDVVRDPDTSLRQIRTPQTLADIVTISSWEYEIRFYRPEDVGVKTGGLYPVSGSPFTTWRVRNPDTSNMTRLEISKIQPGLTEVNEFRVDPATNTWMLVRDGGLRVETKVQTSGTNSRTEITTVSEGVNGAISSKTEVVYHTFPWGEEVVREIVYPYDSSQQLSLVEIAPLVTEYTYFENPGSGGSYSHVATVKRPDGSWEKYSYDGYGNVTQVLRPWKDQPMETGDISNSHATIYKYTNNDGIVVSGFANVIDHVDERINNIRVKRTTYDRTGITLNGEPAVREVMTVYTSATLGIQTVTTRYHRSASNLYANRVASIEHPDGRKDTFTYEYGSYTVDPDPALNQFTPNPSGKAQRETVTHGTVASPAGVALKTTRTVSVTNEEGQSALSETYVYTGSTYERIDWSVTDYDDRSHAIQTRNSNGTMTTTAWTGDRMTSSTDANGIETAYTYDNLNRTKTVTKVGIAAGGGYPAQPNIVTTYNYDAEGRTTSEIRSAGSLTLTKSSKFDLAGRVKEQTDEAGLVTVYEYIDGGRTQKIVAPGGAFTSTENFLDGQTKSITGSAVVARFFDYTVNGDGTRMIQEFVGDGGLSSPRWTKTTLDWAEQTIRTERPGFVSGTNLISTSVYNNKGQRITDSTFAGAVKIVADTRHEHDELGRQIRSGMDVDATGTLTAASTDRMTETEVAFEQSGADWFRTTTTRRYLEDNNPTATVNIQKERVAFAAGSQLLTEMISIDESGQSTSSTIAVDRAAKKVTSITNVPDSVTDAISIMVNGLLQSATPTSPETATTYVYDALGHTTAVISPSTGTTVTAYDPASGRIVSEANGTVARSFEYYPAGHLNAGRLRTQTDAAGKKLYFEYNARGETIRTWGDATYPVEYVFDSYGQRANLRTFRYGKGWQLPSFPASSSGTPDITKWIYHEPTGLLTAKEDAQGRQTVYNYDTASRLQKRTWARTASGNPLETIVSYDPETGEVAGKNYSDATPDVTYVTDRGGRIANITDAAGTHNLTYNAAGKLAGDAVTGGILDGISVSIGYDGFLRRNSLQAMSGTASLINQTYGYDSTSRLETVTSGGQTATYGYFPSSGLLNTTSFTSGTIMARTYDAQSRIQTVTNTPASGTPQSYGYTYNNLNQRTRITREDGSYWSYVYNDRGEVVSGKKFWSDNTPVAGQQFEYGYDNIGNRQSSKSGGDATGNNLRQSSYVADGLNQLSQRTVPGAIDIVGTSDAAATVTVNNQPTYRRGSYFHASVTIDNSTGPAVSPVEVVGVRGNTGPNGEDAVEQRSGSIALPPSVESYTYDADGNILTDGLWQYTWDAENRLTSVTSLENVPGEAKRKVEFEYDHQSRRVQKKTYDWNPLTTQFKLARTIRFVYDEWKLIAEVEDLVPPRSYVHDGSLLMIHDGAETYFVGHDGNENVTGLIKASSGARDAEYDYDPFGSLLSEQGASASVSDFRFSDKQRDSETGLVYYGYRYYNPISGRWINRDLSEEIGGLNLNGFVKNDPVSNVDHLGMWPTRFGYSTHQNSAVRVLTNVLKKDVLKVLTDTLYSADDSEWQTVEMSYRHAMTPNGWEVSRAKYMANGFVKGQLKTAKGLLEKCMDKEAMRYLGLAMHDMQDSTSPAHNFFKTYEGGNLELASHINTELFDPGRGSRLDNATLLAWRYAKGEIPMAADFFDALGFDKWNPPPKPERRVYRPEFKW